MGASREYVELADAAAMPHTVMLGVSLALTTNRLLAAPYPSTDAHVGILFT
jgi:hypothetical protein